MYSYFSLPTEYGMISETTNSKTGRLIVSSLQKSENNSNYGICDYARYSSLTLGWAAALASRGRMALDGYISR